MTEKRSGPGSRTLSKRDRYNIARSKATVAELAEKYGVSIATISKVARSGANARPARPRRAQKRKLTDAQIRMIRTSDESGAELGRKYGVSREMIRQIRVGKCYGDVPDVPPSKAAKA